MTGRRLAVLLAAIAYLAAALAWVGAGRRAQDDVFPPGCALDSGPRGLSLAYAYLAQAGSPVRVLTRPLAAADLPPSAVLFRVRPLMEEMGGRTTEVLAEREEQWVRGGGRLVLALADPRGRVLVEDAAGAVRTVLPLFAGPLVLEPHPARVLSGGVPAESLSIALVGDRPLLLRWPLGRGDVLLLAAPELLENDRLDRADHLRLLLALAGKGRPVWFDEHTHGLGDDAGLVAVLARWRLGPSLVVGALALLVGFWRARARLGPPEPDPRETRSDAVDLLDSLAQLYARALGRRDALRLYHDGLVHRAALDTGLRGAALDARVRALRGGAPPPPAEGPEPTPGQFERTLSTLNDAHRRQRHDRTR